MVDTQTLAELSQAHTSPLWQTPPESLDDRIKVLQDRHRAMVSPLETSAKRAVEVELLLAGLTKELAEAGFSEPSMLDMAFMRRGSHQQVEVRGERRNWFLPDFALVPYLVGHGRPCKGASTCMMRYPNALASPSQYSALVGEGVLREMEEDLGFFETSRKIEYRFDGVFPDAIREMARIADDTGFEVYLVCDARGCWNGEYEPLDPLLVAEKHGRWFLLGVFDPTPLEHWVASEMMTPLPYARSLK